MSKIKTESTNKKLYNRIAIDPNLTTKNELDFFYVQMEPNQTA